MPEIGSPSMSIRCYLLVKALVDARVSRVRFQGRESSRASTMSVNTRRLEPPWRWNVGVRVDVCLLAPATWI
jgi:hypothetical protein